MRWWVLSVCSDVICDVSDVFLSIVMMLTATKPQLIRLVKGQLEVVETDPHGERPEFGPEGLEESLLRTVRSLGVLSAHSDR